MDANNLSWADHHRDEDIAEAIILLEEYAAAFKRDSPRHIQVEIKKRQQIFDNNYLELEYYQNLQKLNRDFGVKDYRQLRRYFTAAFQSLDENFLKIQRARQFLFEHDICNQRECDFDTEVQQFDDPRVIWDVNEPDITFHTGR